MDPLTTGTRVAVAGSAVPDSARPRLARHVRLSFCRTRQRPILQLPETVVVLNASGATILELCDGQRTVAGIVSELSDGRRTVADIVAELGTRYRTVPGDEVRRFLTRLAARRWVELSQSGTTDG